MINKQEFFDKIRKWMSFSRILHSDRLMMILSVLLALAIWFSVISGPANIVDRSIAVDVVVELSENSYVATKKGLRIVSDNQFTVHVNVSGRWSDVSKLRDTDFRVRADMTTITGEGDFNLPLTVSRNSVLSNYDIVSVSPSTVTVTCEYWQEGKSVPIEVDTRGMTAEEGKIIGEPMLETASNHVTVDGPRSVLDRIHTIVARVDDPEPLSKEFKQYEVALVGRDADGNQVDLTDCTFRELPEGKVGVTVPLWVQESIGVTFETLNKPSGLNLSDCLIIDPEVLDVRGSAADVEAFREQMQPIGTIDFSKLSLGTSMSEIDDTVVSQMKFPLEASGDVKIMNATSEVTVRLDADKLAEKTITLQASLDNVVLSADNRSDLVAVDEKQKYTVVIVGASSSVSKIKARDLQLVLGANAASAQARSGAYNATVRVLGYDDVWVCYRGYPDGMTVKATLQ
ncbi:MAG: hypothetical protein IKV35_01915 [Clostridia bacterium]|nr:hypothetical protein [Clostridia bacterium]